jgi:hypothetical protein
MNPTNLKEVVTIVVKDWHEVRSELQAKAIKAVDDSGFPELQKDVLKVKVNNLWEKRKCCKKILEHDGGWEEENQVELFPGCMITHDFLNDVSQARFLYLLDIYNETPCCEKSAYYYPVGRKFTEEDIQRWLEEDNMENW